MVVGGHQRQRGAKLAEKSAKAGFGAVWARWGFGVLVGVLLAASVGRTLSPSPSVVGLLKSDFLAYYY